MIKTLTWWLLSDRQESKHNRKETNRPVSLILFVKENPYLSFTAVTINFLPYPRWWVWNLGLQFSVMLWWQKLPPLFKNGSHFYTTSQFWW
jgi:hypothetical protein